MRRPDKHCIVCENPNTLADWGMPRQMCMIDIDPATIGQYTGLKDKNGVKIFEGDVVQVDAYSYDECETDMCGYIEIGSYGYGIRNEDKEWNYLCDLIGRYTTTYEVIGNIHGGTELLKRKKGKENE